jgi:hypothetical protein
MRSANDGRLIPPRAVNGQEIFSPFLGEPDSPTPTKSSAVARLPVKPIAAPSRRKR